MFNRIIVPVDGSPRSLTAVRFGAAIAAQTGAVLEALTVVAPRVDVGTAGAELLSELASLGGLPVDPHPLTLVGESIPETIAAHVESISDATVVMSTTGRGRSAAVFGSVADAVLAHVTQPLIVIGPHTTEPRSLAGDLIVPIDGTPLGEAALGLVGEWSKRLDARPWLVSVVPTAPAAFADDVVETSYVARKAADLAASIGRPVEYEVLHGGSPGWAIVDHAAASGAALIVMTTHGRTGLRRLAVGSVAADVVRHASCPVALYRPSQVGGDDPHQDGADDARPHAPAG